MPRESRKRGSRAGRLAKAFALVAAGLVLGFTLYVGFIQAGVIRNPFGPVLRGDLESARSDRPGMRVLFVGNSLTYYNDMPALVQRLAEGDPGARPLFAVSYTRPGWSLRGASRNDGLKNLLVDIRWDVVVLQEHSERAVSSPERRERETVPFALSLLRSISSGGARAILFMNWFARDGSDLAAQLSLPVAPFASAWEEALFRRPDLTLLGSDGSHPNLAGSYLAACVFYATLTGRDPSRSSFTAGLPPRDAVFLQRVAEAVTS